MFGDKSEGASKEVGGDDLNSIKLLESAVNIDPNPASGGAEVVLEDGSALVARGSGDYTKTSFNPKTDNGKISVYEVREGDSLSQIADMFGVSVNTIEWANDIDGGSISPGQTLVILPVTGIEYKVESGDTLASIAEEYGANEEEIIDYNGLSSDELSNGQEIIIPDAEPQLHSESASGKQVAVKVESSVNTSGYFKWPVAGGVKTQGIHGYNAIDIGDSIGTPVYASANGSVMVSRAGGWNGGYGSYVVIKHPNGTQTLYAHMNRVDVTTGQSVTQGEVIGAVGNTGKTTGPHLHFEVRGGSNPF